MADKSENKNNISALNFLCSLRISSSAQRWHENRSSSLWSHAFFVKKSSLSAILSPMGIYGVNTQEKRVARHEIEASPCWRSLLHHVLVIVVTSPRQPHLSTGGLTHCQRQFGLTGTTRGHHTTSHRAGHTIC